MTREEILRRAKPILFNTEMVRAILDGKKTVTRRVIKNGNRTPANVGRDKFYTYVDALNGKPFCGAGFYKDSDIFYVDGVVHTDAEYFKMPYKAGDILYVRETFNADWCDHTIYKADGGSAKEAGYSAEPKWRPSIHMPKEAARVFLRVTDVRAERLNEITEEQAKAEGAKAYRQNNCNGTSARIAFAEIWDKTVSEKQYEFLSNPWVWAYEFERLEGAK